MQRPDIKPSDMFKAFNYVKDHLDEWMEEVDDDWNMRSSFSGGDEHLPMHRDKIDLFYSQKGEGLKVIDHEHDMVITARYNVWSEEKEDFVDRVYFRKESEQKKVGDGVLVHEADIDGRIMICESKEPIYNEHMSNEQSIIFANFSRLLRCMHSLDESGITCVHDDRFRFGDHDSCYYGYENREPKNSRNGDIDI